MYSVEIGVKTVRATHCMVPTWRRARKVPIWFCPKVNGRETLQRGDPPPTIPTSERQSTWNPIIRPKEFEKMQFSLSIFIWNDGKFPLEAALTKDNSDIVIVSEGAFPRGVIKWSQAPTLYLPSPSDGEYWNYMQVRDSYQQESEVR